ncbi:MAG TPA: MBL fold metallo-hydrolase [Bacillota bacterium]|nr:MBL fold metallo-hydrolase [Bacillota bacterium]
MKKWFVLFVGVFILINGFALADDSKLTICYEDNAQCELSAPDGTRVLVDVFEPNSLSTAATAKDILLTSHSHSDHMSSEFVQSFPGKQIYIRVGEIKQDGVYIRSIAASHTPSLKFMNENGSMYIFLIEIAGFRIAHLGSIGQEKLTPEQLEALGKIDILFAPIYSGFSGMDDVNQYGLNMIDQIHPSIVIPTHQNVDTVKVAVKRWQGAYIDGTELKIAKSALPQNTQVIFMGPKGRMLGKITKVQKANY